MTTNITYNEIVLRDVLTENVEYTTIYDRGSNRDPIGVRVNVQVTANIHELSPLATDLGLGLGPDALPRGLQRVVEQLSQPRRQFQMWQQNPRPGQPQAEIFFDVWPSAVAAHVTLPPKTASATHPGIRPDIDNGPQTTVRVLQVLGLGTAKIRFTCKFMLQWCDRPLSPGETNENAAAGITSLTYWQAEHLDFNDMTTRRVMQGRIRVLHHDVNVHQALRAGFVLPPLQQGFRRETVHIQENPNGLELGFTVTDKEVRYGVPYPASRWDIRHSVVAPNIWKAMYESSLYIELEGPVNVSKRALMFLGFKIIDAKLHLWDVLQQRLPARNRHPGAFPQRLEIRDHITGGGVQMMASILHFSPPLADGGDPKAAPGNIFRHDLGTPLEIDLDGDGTITPGTDYDAAAAMLSYQHPQTATARGLFKALLGDACQPPRMPQGTDSPGSPTSPYPQAASGEAYVRTIYDQELEDWTTDYSPDHVISPYATYRAESSSERDTGRVALPSFESVGAPGAQGRSIIQLYRPGYTRTITINAQRINEWPIMPNDSDFVKDGVNYKIIWANHNPTGPDISLDGRQKLYTIDSSYEYELDRQPPAIPTVKKPILKTLTQENYVDPSYFIDPGLPGSPL